MAKYFTEHTIYCHAPKVDRVLASDLSITEKVEVTRGVWRVKFLTPTNETFLQRMNIVRKKGSDDADGR